MHLLKSILNHTFWLVHILKIRKYIYFDIAPINRFLESHFLIGL